MLASLEIEVLDIQHLANLDLMPLKVYWGLHGQNKIQRYAENKFVHSLRNIGCVNTFAGYYFLIRSQNNFKENDEEKPETKTYFHSRVNEVKLTRERIL
jgi:hypothetical protein